MAKAVSGWSPVIITVRMPAFLHLSTDSAAPFLGGSIIPKKPRKQRSFSLILAQNSNLKECLNLGLKYPSTITVEPEFNNEQYVVISTKKEYIEPPHKCFLVRWFQKKHTVVEVQVVDSNPYVSTKNQKFIEIVK